MNTQAVSATVQKGIVVDAPLERAFAVFTDGIGSWWPRDYHILNVEIADMTFEPEVGGHILERGIDGSECRWARVLAYEPPHRVVISWDIDPQWRLENDPLKASEVEIRFTSESATRTRVVLEHRHLERHGDAWEMMRDSIAGSGGWTLVLQRYAERIKS